MKTRWNELLDVPDEIKHPDLYQILGTTRADFAPAKLDESYRERMARLQSTRSTKHKEFVEFAKAELRRARRVLADEAERVAYDRELLAERARDVGRFVDVALACGPFTAKSENAIVAAARSVGLTEDEARAALEEELVRRNAGVPAAKLTESSDLDLQPLELDPPSSSKKKKKAKTTKISKKKLLKTPRAAAPTEERPCAHCGRALPARWREMGMAERIGTRLLCAACAAAVHANEACAACSSPLGPLDGHARAGTIGRMCDRCVANVTRLKVCASCELVLPPVAFDRGDAAMRGAKAYCAECLAK